MSNQTVKTEAVVMKAVKKPTNAITKATIASIQGVEKAKGVAADNLHKIISSAPDDVCRKQFEGYLFNEVLTVGPTNSDIINQTRALLDSKPVRVRLGLEDGELGYTLKTFWEGKGEDKKYTSIHIVKKQPKGPKTPKLAKATAGDKGAQVTLKEGGVDWNNPNTWNDLDLALGRILAFHDAPTVMAKITKIVTEA